MLFTLFQQSRQGGRQMNQDRLGYVQTPESLFLVVCDGMGGHLHGEIAAEYTVEFLGKAFRQQATPSLKDPEAFLTKMAASAHRSLQGYARTQKFPQTPSTTCVAAVIQKGHVWWINIGDSRLYLVRNGAIVGQTHDHSHVQILIDAGLITEQEASWHPERNKIYNCIGQDAPLQIDIESARALQPGDHLLLCSDGLWGGVTGKTIAGLLGRCGVTIAVPMLLDIAEGFSGPHCDNLTALAATYWGEREAEPGDTVSEADVRQAIEAVRRTLPK